ncbi:MAG: hypothetical protein A4E23_00069 [Methanomethylovorans sp. PtaU1.Bin073]|nr:MAG: hypothetical protein A4E23_00069 [Methanomethylovorans sp. PtaU1.Bin073]
MSLLVTFVLGMWAGMFITLVAIVAISKNHPIVMKTAALLQLIIHGK